VIRQNYRIGVPEAGNYEVIFNSDSTYYAGSNAGSHSLIESQTIPWMNRKDSVSLTLPPLAALVLKKKI
jgi:1,4-alpha-glucan branching enzyme